MQYQGPAKVVAGDASVLFVFQAVVPHTGNYQVGEGLTFSGGAAGVAAAYTAGLLSFVIPGDVRPLPGEDIDGDVSAVSTTLTSYDLDPNLTNFGVEDGDFLVREGDRVGYLVGSVPQAWRLELAANYAGASNANADVIVHTTRTSFAELPLFDRRDRELFTLLTDAMQRLDAKLSEHDERIADLEP